MGVLDVREPASRFEVGQWPDLGDPVRRAELTPAALAGMSRLAERWQLTVRQVGDLLGGGVAEHLARLEVDAAG